MVLKNITSPDGELRVEKIISFPFFRLNKFMSSHRNTTVRNRNYPRKFPSTTKDVFNLLFKAIKLKFVTFSFYKIVLNKLTIYGEKKLTSPEM